jgi:iron complex outermembrane receptor protein
MLKNRDSWSMACLVAGLLLVLSFCSAFAQTGTLRGKVTDAQSGEALPQANVVVTATGVETGGASSVTGEYEVRGLAAGTYTVSVSYIGYEKKVISNVTIAAGETKVLDIALAPGGIQFNPLVVSASRRQEKALEAPAAISVLEATQIRGRAVTTPTDYLRGLPAVDVATNGIAQSNVTVRGFNNIFSTVLLSLTDNRYANVPSLRLNAYNFIPLTSEDISRIEVVSGPGSALYGPNTANGVMHIITRSPFESEGTSVSVGGGGRDFLNISQRDPNGGRNIYMASARHASALTERIGLKISAQYYKGRDWESFDSLEPSTVRKFRPTAQGADSVGTRVSNQPDFDVEKMAAEGRLDFRLSDNATLIFNGGYNRGNNIELTGIGRAQAIDWTYIYAQARFNYKNLFVQSFINGSDAGDTYIRRTGQLIVDNSKLYVGQIQHGLTLGERQRFTYGVDAIFTRPNSDGTIYGRNENDDDLNEIGAYIQSETKVFSRLDVVAAARIDDNNHLQDPVFSPRAALVFKPTVDQNLRVTYNRAFSTQSPLDLFLDILQRPVANPFAPLGQLLNPQGYAIQSNLLTVRARGVPIATGFHFQRGADGRPQMRSQFDRNPGYADARLTDEIWAPIRTGLVAQNAVLNNLLPTTLSQLSPQGVNGIFRNVLTQAVVPAASVEDLDPVKPSITTTFELGYKGLIAQKLLVGVDLYHTKVKDRVAGLKPETHAVFADPNQLGAILVPYIVPRLVAAGVPQAQAQAQAVAIVSQIAGIPFGVISPKELENDPSRDTDVLFSYRNFKEEISLNGLDLNFSYYATQSWVFSGNYSFITEHGLNFFKRPNRVIWRNVDQKADIALNAPGHKAALSIQYRAPQRGYDAELRGRYVEGFPMESGDFVGEIQTYTVFDFNFGYELPFSSGTRFSINVQNVFDKKHIEFVSAPVLGRLILTRITQTL